MCAGGQPQTTWDEKIQQFLTTFVESESEFDCELPGLLIQQMESLLPLGHGKECLVQAQEHVLKVHDFDAKVPSSVGNVCGIEFETAMVQVRRARSRVLLDQCQRE